MADTFSRDRLQPALLDRLIDENPGSGVEPLDARSMTKVRLRQSVLRDLSWLLNAQASLDASVDETAFAHALRSTLNYGMPALSGMLVSKIEIADLEAAIRQAILDFEPRVLPGTLQVRGIVPDDPLGHHNVISFEINGQLWAQPYPLELLLKTDVDLESGMIELHERGTSAAYAAQSGGGGAGR
jgi:type VI secretion system protein ImpF